MLAALLIPATASGDDLIARIDAGLGKSSQFLLSQQGEDGGWHSEAYGVFREGHTITPIVLSALLFAPQQPGLDAAFKKGSDFVARLEPAERLDYPVYTLSASIWILSLPQNARHKHKVATLVEALKKRQLVEHNGWSSDDLEYGGWGYFHGIPKKQPQNRDEILGSNITSTLFAIGALQLAGMSAEDPALKKARIFVERCQNYPGDGGFFFSPTARIGNKAGEKRSYGTATADGFRALLRLEKRRDHERIEAAASWLVEHFDPEKVPGNYLPDREVQRASAYHYWTWTVAHALFAYPEAYSLQNTGRWPRALAEALLKKQAAAGWWRNSAIDLREDDPLVATPLAGAALSLCRSALTGVFRHGPN